MSNEKGPARRVPAFLRRAQGNLDQKQVVLIFRWLLIVVVAALMLSGGESAASPRRSFLLVLLFILTNFALSFVPRRFFERLALTGPMLVADIGFVTAAIYVSGNLTGDLYLLYFLTILLAAITRDVKSSVLSSIVVILFYGGVSSWQLQGNQFLTASFLVRIPFFLLTAVFSGFLASQVRLKEKEAEKANLFNISLQKELGRALKTEEATREELRALYQHDQNILESLGTGVLVIGDRQIITTFNAEATRITGLSKNSVVGKHLSEVPGLAPLGSLVTDAAHTGKVCVRDERVIDSRDGSAISIGLSTSVLRDAQQNPCGAIAIFKDLSDLKELERKVKKSEHLALLGEMAASVAHEIRNPLNSISGFAQLIAERTEEGDKRKFFSQIVIQESKRIGRIIEDTLLFSKDAPRDVTLVDVNEVLQSSAGRLSEKAQRSGIELKLDLYPELAPVKGSAGQLEQVFNNLILNAIQAMGATGTGGSIRIATKNCDDAVEVTVKDAGPGIPAGMVDMIFLPFFTTKQDGTGLGLSVCSKILEDHNGCIEVESEPGHGATFRVSLPTFAEAREITTDEESEDAAAART